MFVFVLELLNQEGHMAFFELQKGGRKANNAQKEKWCLARKWSCAVKREREREAAKADNLPLHKWVCLTCGRKFQSCKTAKWHKCARHSKVVRNKGKGVEGSSLRLAPSDKPKKPAPTPGPIAPTAPTYSNVTPPVTGDLGDSSIKTSIITRFLVFSFTGGGFSRLLLAEMGQKDEEEGSSRKWRWQ